MLGTILALSLLGHAVAHEARSVEAHATVTARAADRQAKMIDSLVRRGDPAAVAYVVRAVGEGLPPVALLAFLEAAQAHPKPAYAPVLHRLATYRSTRVRAWALLALAAVGEAEAHRAVKMAMVDVEVGIRLLGLEMAQTHTTPELEEWALRLLDRDSEVATLWAARRR